MRLLPFAPCSFLRGLRQAPPRRGFSFAGAFFLLGMIGIAVMIYFLNNKNEHEAVQKMILDLSDPKTALTSFFIERGARREFRDKNWSALLEYQTTDDRQWLAQHVTLLAGLNQKLGITAPLGTPAEQEFAALEFLLGFGFNPDRPFVSTVEQHGDYAIAYYQMPNNLSSMTPAFLHNDGGQWHIMRFLGMRDSTAVMEAIVGSKTFGRQSLDADEQLYYDRHNEYIELKRAQLFALVGLPPPGKTTQVPAAQASLAGGTPAAATATASPPNALPQLTPLGRH